MSRERPVSFHVRDRLAPVVNSPVYINGGPFAGFRGVIESRDGAYACVRITLKNGRSVLFEMDEAALEVEVKRRPAETLMKTGTIEPATGVAGLAYVLPDGEKNDSFVIVDESRSD